MTAIVHGIYSKGIIELLETPRGIRDGKVRLILLDDEAPVTPMQLPFGKYQSATLSTEEDFVVAEWHDEST